MIPCLLPCSPSCCAAFDFSGRPHVVVATPGRLRDHLQGSDKPALRKCRYVIQNRKWGDEASYDSKSFCYAAEAFAREATVYSQGLQATLLFYRGLVVKIYTSTNIQFTYVSIVKISDVQANLQACSNQRTLHVEQLVHLASGMQEYQSLQVTLLQVASIHFIFFTDSRIQLWCVFLLYLPFFFVLVVRP